MIRKFLVASALSASALAAGHTYKVKAGAPPLINGAWVGTLQSFHPLFDPDETDEVRTHTLPITLNIPLAKTALTGTVSTVHGDGTIDGVVITKDRFLLLNVTFNANGGRRL